MRKVPVKHIHETLSELHKSKFYEALELMELGIDLMRQNMRRKMQGATEESINLALQQWINKSSLIQN